MYKIFMYFFIFTSIFAINKVKIKELDTQTKNGIIYVTMKSMNGAGAKIKKTNNIYKISTDIGTFTLEGNKIITPKKEYKYLSLPYEKEGKVFLPLDIILNLNGYHLENGVIRKTKEMVSPTKSPKTIISLSPGVSEKVFALGGGDLLVGRAKYGEYPVELKKVDIVGTMLSPNLEVIIEKAPDLVLAETHFKESIMKKIESFDIKVLKFKTPKNIDEIYESISVIGIAIGRAQEARALNASLEDKVKFTKIFLNDVTSPTVYYIVGTGKSEFTPGKNTFMDDIITLAGGDNIASDNVGWKYSLESLIIKDPEIIFGSQEYINIMVNGENYQSLSAIKNKTFVVIPNVNVFQLPGPRALIEGVYQMIEIFHPELAKEYKKKVL